MICCYDLRVPTPVPCPKCRGGCDLCGGAGSVNESVSRIYLREETRRTVKMPAKQLKTIWDQEAPTKPQVIVAADRRRTFTAYVLVVVVATILGIGLALLGRALFR